ncbi:MAG: AAA family ATPase [Spirochaetales bacterium]|nr:AAA family ATPase [Spirochaetales bacterium]
MEKAVLEKCITLTDNLLDHWERIIWGKRPLLENLLTGVLAGGHILLEDVPGSGKTTMAKTLASLIGGGRFKRIQFTPDLLPYDITGVEVWEKEREVFLFQKGPVFTNILLADEINRTTPKVQSALLEVMAESQVTVGNKTYPLDPPFVVLATENPIEMEGTYPLPAAQLDRFLMKLTPGYPDRETEYRIVRENPSQSLLPQMEPVAALEDILFLKKAAEQVHCDERLIKAAVDSAALLRERPDVRLGVSTRGAIMLIAACRGKALTRGRDYVIDQDIKEMAPLVWSHRIIMKGEGRDTEDVLEEVVNLELARLPRT